MLTIEGKYIGSTFHKGEDKTLHHIWDFTSAVFYSMTVCTAIGYGAITCSTTWGKALTIVYASIGIPLMLVVLSDIGGLLTVLFTKVYALCLKVYKIIRRKVSGQSEQQQEENSAELPMLLSIGILVVYLILCSCIVAFLDYENDKYQSLSFGDSLYFCFISMSTIGFGDVMPNNIQVSLDL
uniref:Potassium channel domain-containing protein n=1 Tax=Acrobeloides nanus TaxID=290746 RepID=A0A914C701_9BILA